MAFTTEIKYGYSDGQHIGWWGDEFALFARVVGGELFALGKQTIQSKMPNVMTMSRAWMNNPFQNTTDSAYFTEKPNATAYTAIPWDDLLITRPIGSDMIRPMLLTGGGSGSTNTNTGGDVVSISAVDNTKPATTGTGSTDNTVLYWWAGGIGFLMLLLIVIFFIKK